MASMEGLEIRPRRMWMLDRQARQKVTQNKPVGLPDPSLWNWQELVGPGAYACTGVAASAPTTVIQGRTCQRCTRPWST